MILVTCADSLPYIEETGPSRMEAAMQIAEQLRVLVVDDEHIIADTLAAILEVRGCIARAAYSAEEATTAAEELRPHAVISDVVMSGMNGLALADWLEENYPFCKVLLVSGNLDVAQTLAESHRSGRHRAILPKPVYPEEILRFIDSCATVSGEKRSAAGADSAAQSSTFNHGAGHWTYEAPSSEVKH